ncbi:MAG: sugar ABC transporter ATP-binding protein [Spirochaetaceae bacterium]|nr:sugar ABC transporter ATP-binding protein [Spirochaetaceae bacterium]
MAEKEGEYILELRHITKTFPGVRALDDVHFTVRKGEIHALMGENGAGKSTFIKIITGVHLPDQGDFLVDGKPANVRAPLDAQALGIAVIYQHVTCFPDISVAENIFMGHEKTSGPFNRIDWKTMNREAAELLAQLDAKFDARSVMGTLSVAQQQIVEIAKALSANARIIIMDEPTAPLSNRESEDLYRITEGLKQKGVSVIFISHRFEDMYRLADRVTVLRDGKYINTWDIKDVDNHTMVTAMVGREIVQFFPKREVRIGEDVLKVEGLSRMGFFRDVSFSVRKGEVLALTGLVGARRTEVCEAIYGISGYDSGTVTLEGRKLNQLTPTQAIAEGIGLLPEDRLKEGLVLRWEIAKNISLPVLDKFVRFGWLDARRENEKAGEAAEKLAVKAVSVHDLVSTLSGGNQQKVIVGKMLNSDMKVIILDEPTKGVDVGAKTAIYSIMNDLAAAGYGIIMISSEMPEVLGMSDCVVVMREGVVTTVMDTAEATQESILKAAMGE